MMLASLSGWRRKIGCVILVMACILAFGWCRTSVYTDQFEFGIANSNHFLTSTQGYFRWTCVTKPEFMIPGWKWHSVAYGSPGEPLDNTAAIAWDWRWEWLLCEIGQGRYRGSPFTALTIPCFIAIPLTALSAWLLLTRRRESKVSEKQT